MQLCAHDFSLGRLYQLANRLTSQAVLIIRRKDAFRVSLQHARRRAGSFGGSTAPEC